MLRFASSVAQSLSDSLTPLYRSPVESLIQAWTKAEELLRDIERQQHQQLIHPAQPDQSGDARADPSSSSASSPASSPSLSWCSPALLSSLNALVEAVRREAQDKHAPASGKAIASPISSSTPSSPPQALSPPPTAPSASAAPALPVTPFTPGTVSPVKGGPPAVGASPVSTPPPSSATPALPRRAPCTEYLVHERVVESLVRFALDNRPVGLRVVLTKAIDGVLTVSAAPLLARPEIAAAVALLVQRSADDGDLLKRNAGRMPLLALCRTVSARIKQSEQTAVTWTAQPAAADERQTNGSGHPSPPLPSSQPPACLVAGLLVSMVNHWSNEGRLAAAGLFDLACSPQQPALLRFLVHSTQFPSLLVAGVVELVAQLPPVSSCPPFAVLFRTNEAASQLLERLRFIDALCLCGPSELTDAVTSAYTAVLLERTVTPLLMDVGRITALTVREDVARWATLFLHHCVREATAPNLRAALVHFALGPPPSTFDVSSSPPSGSSGSPTPTSPADRALLVRRTLIKRLDSLSDGLCQSTLQLFITLLQTRDPLVFDCLIPSVTPSVSSTPSASEPASPLQDGLGSPPPSSPSPAFAFSPAKFEGFDDPHGHPDYADALLDAQAEALSWTTAFSSAPPSSPPSPSYPASDAAMFLTTLAHKLDALFDHRLPTNLRLSFVVALLFHCPSPRVREQLARVSAAATSPPSVLSTLAGLWKAGRRRQQRLPSFSTRLAACKQRMSLMAAQAASSSASEHGTAIALDPSAAVSPAGPPAESLDVETFLQAWLVLEGVLLELSAISENDERWRRMQSAAAAATAASLPKGEADAQK